MSITKMFVNLFIGELVEKKLISETKKSKNEIHTYNGQVSLNPFSLDLNINLSSKNK